MCCVSDLSHHSGCIANPRPEEREWSEGAANSARLATSACGVALGGDEGRCERSHRRYPRHRKRAGRLPCLLAHLRNHGRQPVQGQVSADVCLT